MQIISGSRKATAGTPTELYWVTGAGTTESLTSWEPELRWLVKRKSGHKQYVLLLCCECVEPCVDFYLLFLSVWFAIWRCTVWGLSAPKNWKRRILGFTVRWLNSSAHLKAKIHNIPCIFTNRTFMTYSSYLLQPLAWTGTGDSQENKNKQQKKQWFREEKYYHVRAMI